MSPETSSTSEAVQFTLLREYSLDTSMYSLEGEELEFVQMQAGITEEEELKKHIIEVQSEAYAIYPYPCIRGFRFLHCKLPKLPGYDRLLRIGRERPGAILLDIGCCFGTDTRRAAADGFPVKQIVASDLHPEYWDLGHKLFRTTNETFPAKFVPGDVFDPAHIAAAPPLYSPPVDPVPDLAALTSLNPLRGHVAAIHVSSFFHLFNEEKQSHIARVLGGLLSPVPGSLILGSHAADIKMGISAFQFGPEGSKTYHLFCHSPESWTELWDGQVFKKGTVQVETRLVERTGSGYAKLRYMQWCVTRL
ncbi:hypothetical protein BD414DRAFT_442586 [Trametes punicea]|nr:hypothetical protein BD414DRAFT_442586 [Trametes punicea]